jgi:hypothetical protein
MATALAPRHAHPVLAFQNALEDETKAGSTPAFVERAQAVAATEVGSVSPNQFVSKDSARFLDERRQFSGE